MKIQSISFKNNVSGWSIDSLLLQNLSLCVGASGVGKTQILNAITTLKDIALGASRNGVEWEVRFEQESKSYVWVGAFASNNNDDVRFFEERKPSPILFETLVCEDVVIVNRDKDSIYYSGERTVKLDVNKSVVYLLKEELPIAPIYSAFKLVYWLKTEDRGIRIPGKQKEENDVVKDVKYLRNHRFFSPVEKLFLLKQNNQPEFKEIEDEFISFFPMVENLDFAIETLYDGRNVPVLILKEKNINAWIPQNNISSGMFRSLVQIIELALARDGDVILIDEFENGLGVNCINRLAEMILYPEHDIQFLITSHHPYIINNIPYSAWKIVTRSGSKVSVSSAENLHIGSHSSHDAFMQLIQTSAYRNGSL